MKNLIDFCSRLREPVLVLNDSAEEIIRSPTFRVGIPWANSEWLAACQRATMEGKLVALLPVQTPVVQLQRFELERIESSTEPNLVLVRPTGEADSYSQISLAFKYSLDAQLLLDPQNGHILEVNGRLLELFEAHDRNQVIGQDGIKLLHAEPMDRAARDTFNETVTRKGKMETLIPYRTLKGREFWGQASIVQLPDQGSFLIRIRDVSDKVAIEQKMRGQQHMLNEVLKLEGNTVFIKDKTGRYLLASHNFALSVDNEPQELIGKTDFDLVSHSRAIQYTNQDALVLRKAQAQDFEDIVNSPEGNRYFQIRKAPYFDEQGNLSGIVGVSLEITQLRQQTIAMRDNYELLRETQLMARTVDWELDAVNMKLSFSEWSQQILGLKSSQPHDWNSLQYLLPEEDRSRLLRSLVRCIKHGESFQLVHSIILPYGKKMVVQSRAKALFSELPNIVRVVGISKDITDLKAREQEYLAALTRAEAILKHTPIGIALVRTDGTLIEYNPAFGEIMEQHVLDLEAPFKEFAYLDTLPSSLARGETLTSFERGQGYTIEKRYPSEFGPTAWIRINVQLVPPTLQSEKYYVAVIRDFSAARKHETEIRRAKDEAEAANNAKSQFLAHLSHDILNPLNGIAGCLELLTKGPLNAEQKYYAELIQLSYRKVAGIMNNILDFSRMEAGQADLSHEPFDLRKLIDGSVLVHDFLAREKRLLFEYTIKPKDNGPPVMGDPTAVGRILDNLLGNAIKFTREGSVKLTINWEEIQTHIIGLKIEVQDTGVGLDPHQLEKIFDAFYQADTSTTKEVQGTGLGLSIVKHYIDRMDGSIHVTSLPGKGTTFSVYLPLQVPDDETASFELDLDGYRQLVTLRERARILIAEDDEINAEYLYKLLTGLGLRVQVAYNGQQALRLLQKKDFDLLLSDGAMPQMDGYELIRTLRTNELNSGKPRMPVIAVTGYAQRTDRQLFFDAGADDYIIKPIDEKMLLRKLHELLP